MADSQESLKPEAAAEMAANSQDAPVEAAKNVNTSDAPIAPKAAESSKTNETGQTADAEPNKTTGSKAPTPSTKVNASMNRVAERMMKLENGRPKPNPFPPCEPLVFPRRNRTSYTHNSPFQLTAEDWPIPLTIVETDDVVSTDPNVPSIRVKNTDPDAGPSGNVPPVKNVLVQSPNHLQVVNTRRMPPPPADGTTGTSNNNNAPTQQKKQTSFWDKLDHVLGLHRVRGFGDETCDPRLVAKKPFYRVIMLFGIGMMISFIVSIIVVVTDGGKGGETEMGTGWWAWMASSAACFVGAIVVFVWAVQKKKKVLYGANIRSQVLRRLEQDVEMNAVIGRPSNNEQQAQRAAAAQGQGTKCLKTGGVYKKGEWAEKK